MLREWTVGKCGEGSEDPPNPFGIHDERSHVVGWLGIDFEIRHIIADPLLLRFAPPNLPAFLVPWFAGGITRCAVVHHSTICGPRPGPVLIDTKTGRIIRSAPLHHWASLGPGTRIQPVTTGCRSVIPQPGKARHLLSGFDGYSGLRGISEVPQCLAINFFSNFGQRRIQRSRVGPREIQDRVGKLSAFLLIKFAHFQEDTRENLLVYFSVTWRRN